MQISSSSSTTSSMALTALRNLFQAKSTETTGQKVPIGSPPEGTKGQPSGPPPGPPPAGMNGGGVSIDTMSALLVAQEDASDIAAYAIDAADINGDGTVSLSELAVSLDTDENSLTNAFAKVDADDDGQINGDELEAGLKATGVDRRPQPPSAADLASGILEAADADGGGSLSLSEIASSLGTDDQSSLSGAFAKIDANADGSLAADELTAALEAALTKSLAAYAYKTTTESTSLSLAA